jgi:hypothetical protein
MQEILTPVLATWSICSQNWRLAQVQLLSPPTSLSKEIHLSRYLRAGKSMLNERACRFLSNQVDG